MALEINGYNKDFQSFVNFARIHDGLGEKSAIARIGTGVNVQAGALAGRTITASTTDSVRSFFKWFRSSDDKVANNAAREIFKNAIIDMFGGESKIPQTVKDAMKLADYDCGKPLTARRIMAVKAAIDADGTAKTRARQISIAGETFQSPDVADAAQKLGFTRGELPKLARAAHLYAQTAGVNEMDAMKEVAEPNSKANRLMQYGGRFLDNAENFANGLRLMDSFNSWFTQVHDTKKSDGNTFANAQSVSELNFREEYSRKDCTAAFERFVFEDLAVNDGADLNEPDPEKLFGMKNNAAMRFFGTGRCYNFTGVMASVPPERRGAIFAVFDKLCLPLPETKEDAKAFYEMDTFDRGIHNPHLVIGRILRHLPEIEQLAAKGALTEKNIAKTLFPDMQPRNWTRTGINQVCRNVDTLARETFERGGMDEAEAMSAGSKVQLIMEETCCTLKEAIDAFKTGSRAAPPKYMTTATFSLEKLDGTTNAARDLLDGGGTGDLYRAYNYGAADDPLNQEKFFIKNADNMAFGFTFPDGTSLKANAGAHKANIPTIIDKLESLAGKVHPRQQSALMFAVSQAGTGVLNGGLMAFGIRSSEHAAVNFELSKDNQTGAITVRYTSPEELLPLRFSWTATIDVDGNMTSTPLVAEKPIERFDSKAAGIMVDDAAKKLGAKLTGAEKREAMQFLQTHATNMYPTNAKLFAGFLVNLARSDYHDDETKTAMVEEMAASIREWRSFGFGDKGMSKVATAAKDYANFCISDYMKPERNGKFVDNIYTSMRADSNRATYILNGKTYVKRPAEELLGAFKELVPDPKKQRAISSWLNQICLSTFMIPSSRNPYDNGVEALKLPGGTSLINLSLGELFDDQVLDSENCHIVHDLQISPDGKTATITQSATVDLHGARLDRDTSTTFGKTTLSMRLVINLDAEIPTVTDFQLSQKLA